MKETYYIGYNKNKDSFEIRTEDGGFVIGCKCDENDRISYTFVTQIREILKLGYKIDWRDIKN